MILHPTGKRPNAWGQRPIQRRCAFGRLQESQVEGLGQPAQALIGGRLQFAQQSGGARPLKVVPPENEALVAALVRLPQPRLHGERHQGCVNHPRGKVVDLTVVERLPAVGVLVVAMADLVAGASGQGGHEHAVVVDQPQSAVDHQYVAMLQVAVADAGLAQTARPAPLLGQGQERGRAPQVPFYVRVERFALHPFHFQDGVPAPTHTDAVGQESEVDHIGQPHPLQVVADGSIPFLVVAVFTEETADSIDPLAGADELIDAGEATGDRTRQPQRRQQRLAQLEFRIGEGLRGF